MEWILDNISTAGITILSIQSFIFITAIWLSIYQEKKLSPLKGKLKNCREQIADNINKIDLENPRNRTLELAIECRERYQHAASAIENISAENIAANTVDEYPIIRTGPKKWTLGEINELIVGAPSFLITLGLIGTFYGLIQNMSKLSLLLTTQENLGQTEGLINNFANIFPAMGAAFSTSLAGVFYSSTIWILSILLGTINSKERLEQSLCDYLEHIVQVNCRTSSLSAALDRMEDILTDYLSNFTNIVGGTIERSVDRAIGNLVNSLKGHVDKTAAFTREIEISCGQLKDAGQVFSYAADQLHESSFADEFSKACSKFINHTNLLAQASQNIEKSSTDLSGSIDELNNVIEETGELQSAQLKEISVSSKAMVNTSSSMIDVNEKSISELQNAVIAIQNIQKRGMTWLSMRAKTDEKITDLNEDLRKIVVQFASVNERIISSSQSTFDTYRKEVNRISEYAKQLANLSNERKGDYEAIKEGLNQMKSIDEKLNRLSSD